MTAVAVLGAGVMASALTVPLADNGHDVRLVGTHLDTDIIESLAASGPHPGLGVGLPGAVRPFAWDQAAEAFDGAEVVLSGVNSFGVRWAGEQLARLLPDGAPVVAIAKGLAADGDGTLRILPELLRAPWSAAQRQASPVSAIVGPSIAGELAVRHDTCVVFAGRDQDALDRLGRLFATEYYRIWTSSDLVGCEVCAALKNCYALGTGLAEGLLEARGEADGPHRMHNLEAAVFAQGAAEMRVLLAVMGSRPEIADALPGVGDMYVTSTGGRNVRVGRLLGAGVPFDEAHARLDHVTLEGAAAIAEIGAALPELADRGLLSLADFPLLRHLHAVIAGEAPPAMPWETFGFGVVRPLAR